MTKIQLIKKVAKETGFTQKEAAKVLNSFLECLQESLTSGSEVKLSGFGTFSVANRKERVGRNPGTGEKITIPASRNVKFKPSKVLRESLK